MKKIILFAFLTVLLHQNTFSQLSFVEDTMHIIAHVGKDDVAHGFIVNDNASELGLKWRRMVNDLQSGTSAICDLNVCHSETTDFAEFNIDGGGTNGTMDVHFYADAYNEDTSKIEVAVFDPSDSLPSVVTAYITATLSPIALTFPSFAQAFTNETTSSSVSTITNYGSDTLTLRWTRTDFDATAGDPEICIDGNCEGVGTTSGILTLMPMDSAEISAQFTLNSAKGQSFIEIVVEDTGAPETINTTKTRYSLVTNYPTSVGSVIQNNISIYPNPARGQVFLKGDVATISNIKITNVFGQTIYNSKAVDVINIDQIDAGAYWIMITDKEQKTVVKNIQVL